MLTDREWKLKYTPEDGDLVRVFYVPALQDAARYDRLTGYFDAGALALAARGVEGLVRNDGRMRLVVGCTLGPPEIDAIREGEALRDRVERRLVELPLAPPDADAAGALELLAWMIGRGHLDVKVAVPCDADGQPVNDTAIFHEKSGFIEDRAGHRIAWTGSLNETAGRLAAQLGEHQRLPELGSGTGAGGRRGAELRPPLGQSFPARHRARRAGRRPARPAAVPAAGSARAPAGEAGARRP